MEKEKKLFALILETPFPLDDVYNQSKSLPYVEFAKEEQEMKNIDFS